VRYTADELGFHPITELEIDIPDADELKRQRTTTTKKPDLDKKYLPPTTYLPPSNLYLPPAGKAQTKRNEIPRDIQLPRF
jgi:hypothetical protein